MRRCGKGAAAKQPQSSRGRHGARDSRHALAEFVWRVLTLAAMACGVIAGAKTYAADLRIVSLGPAITEQVNLLGMASNLVGVTSFCRMPEGTAQPPRVGTVTGINTEQILALQPDLVCAIGLTHPRDVAQLERLGLRVVHFNYARNFDDIVDQFLQLGGLLGRAVEADRVASAARARLAALAARLENRAPPSVFIEIGTRPLFTADRDSYITDMIKRAGGRNVAAETKGGFYSREQVVAENPDVIVIVAMGVVAEEERDAWLSTAALHVSDTRRVHVMDAYTVCSPTPEQFVVASETLAELLHPALAESP